MKSPLRVWFFTMLSICSGSALAAGTCLRIGDEIPTALQLVWKVPSERIALLRDAHRKMSAVSGLNPKLEVCGTGEINAAAVDEAPQHIDVNTGLLLITDDKDELAAVIAHEFAHLLMSHRAKKEEQAKDAIKNGVALGRSEVIRGASVSTAVRDAILSIKLETSSFSRVAEREADDVGIKLASRAGYDPGGAAALARRLTNARGAGETGFLSSHPGWGERAWYSGRMAANENFRDKAVTELNAGDVTDLSKTIAAWKASAPDSGGAAYYGAFAAVLSHRPISDVSAELENAVRYFAIDADSLMGEEYAREAVDASVSLCVALYREGRVYPALNCVKRLPPEGVREFKRTSGWSQFLVLGPSREVKTTTVFGAHSLASPIMISTCRAAAMEHGLKEVRPWAALREVHVSAFRLEPRPMIRDPTLCDCSATTLNQLKLSSWIVPY
jgi:hypothetical protein